MLLLSHLPYIMRVIEPLLLLITIQHCYASLRSDIRTKIQSLADPFLDPFLSDALWAGFKKEHNRSYPSLREELRRKSIFGESLLFILQHNLRMGKRFHLGVNEFADLTPKEFATRMGLESQSPLKLTSVPKAVFRNTTDGEKRYKRVPYVQFLNPGPNPTRLDWRVAGAVTKPKNQGPCGSCWAHTTAGAIEGVNAIKTGFLTEVSVQQLIDCVRPPRYVSDGCTGGRLDEAMDWVVRNRGVASHARYPIVRNGDSRSCKSAESVASIDIFAQVTSEKDLESALVFGPVAAGIDASSRQFQYYREGIVSSSCSRIPNHAVLVVGYDEESWIVKNSWGPLWGEEGFFRLKRGANMCGIAEEMVMAFK